MSEELDLDKERLGKIIQLAKNGLGGEKATAIRLVKALCKKHGLNFTEVMADSDVEALVEYTVKYRTDEEHSIMVQIFCSYAQMNAKHNAKYNAYRRVMIFNTTKQRYIEFLNAVDVLLPLWRKEKKIMQEAVRFGFYDRHDLYYHPTDKERKTYFKNKKQDKDEEKARMAGRSLASYMDEAIIRKQLGSLK